MTLAEVIAWCEEQRAYCRPPELADAPDEEVNARRGPCAAYGAVVYELVIAQLRKVRCLEPDDIIGNVQVRRLAAGDKQPIARATLISWRRHRDFPEPFKVLPGGIELWDARAVNAWVKGR